MKLHNLRAIRQEGSLEGEAFTIQEEGAEKQEERGLKPATTDSPEALSTHVVAGFSPRSFTLGLLQPDRHQNPHDKLDAVQDRVGRMQQAESAEAGRRRIARNEVQSASD